MRLLVTRPKEDAAPLIEILKQKGHDPVLFALLDIVAEPEGAKALKDFKVSDIQALLVTSANGVRAFADVDKRRSFKVLAVGAASAEAAREAGFKQVESADGDVIALAALVKKTCDPAKGKLLHIAGSSVAGDLKGLVEKDGFGFERVVLYRADQITDLSDSLKADIKSGKIDGVLLYSPRTAASFAELVRKAGLENDIKNMVAYGLSEAVASKIKHLLFKEIKIAPTPDQAALLDLIIAPEDGDMTVKKDDDKKNDPKVIEAKAEEVKIKDAPKPEVKDAQDKTKTSTASMAGASDKKNDPKAQDSKTGAKVDDPVEKALNAKKAQDGAKKKTSFKAKAIAAGLVLVAGGAAGAYFTQDIWVPKAKAEIARILNIETQTTNAHSDEMLQSVLARLEKLESKSDSASVTSAPAPDLTPLLERLAQLEGVITALKQEVSTIEIANGSEDKLAEFKELASRLEAVEGSKPQDLSGIEAEAQRLSQLVSELNVRLSDVEAAKMQARTVGENAQALIAGLSALRQAMETSSPYAAPLQALGVLAQGDVVLEEAVAKLQDNAESGLASTSALRTSFEKTADDIVRAVAIPEGAGWMEQTMKNITSLVTIRHAPDNLDGEGALGIVARAEHNVRNGDLGAAIVELQKLEGNSLEAATPWIKAAQARLEGDRQLSLMQAHILSLMAANGGQG